MRMVVEVEAELTGRTLAEFEAELMGQLRRQLGPVVAKAVTEVAGRVPVGLCPSCGGRRERRGRDLRQVVGLFGAVALQSSCQGLCKSLQARRGDQAAVSSSDGWGSRSRPSTKW